MPSPLTAAFAIGGLILGFLSDRLATRWPEHEAEHPAGRRIGWRTVLVAGVGACALGALPGRFEGDGLALALFGAWFAVLIVGLGTDLDQRLLPDILTLPVIPIALLYDLAGRNPLVGAELLPAVIAAVVIPLVLYIPSIPFGEGAFGLGDVKFLAGAGLMLGLPRSVNGVLFALVLGGIVLLALLATRRIGRRSFVPFGPFLILGAFWVVLLRI